MAKQVINPQAVLTPRESDVKVTDEQFLKIGLFAKLKRKPSLDKFPGAMVLRRFRKGEVIFRQGEAGWTALYILTSEDLLAVQGRNAVEFDPTASLRPEEVTALRLRLDQLQRAPERGEELRTVATVNLAIARPPTQEGQGFLKRLRRRLLGGRAKRSRPQFIPIDGPRDLDYESLQAGMFEGEMFGEGSCLYRTPRSGTVVATRDCYMLELLRNILDQLQKDPAYKAQTDEIYKRRVFELHLRQLPIFADLTEEQLNEVRAAADLQVLETGQLIFDEYDRSDCMYIIRSGLVKVIRKVSTLLTGDSVRSFPELATALREGEGQPATPRGKLWLLLPEKLRGLVRGVGAEPPEGPVQAEILQALNELIKNRQLADAKEFQTHVASPTFLVQATDNPGKKRADWPDQDLRRLNRLLLETILGRCLRPYRRRVGPENVLSYLSRGEFLGEIGLMTGNPRGATCIAYGHPQEGASKDSGRVELVKIPEAVFRRLLETSPSFRDKVEKEIAARSRVNRKLSGSSVWDDESQVLFSKRFEQLGLIQGQRLMLIDLDRCTRCDECVKACANTHDDGRSRLFLEGPRFDRFLVPATCRSCLDPVCMIGCPVGSIHRGNNLQIEIEDWCIGCGLCAKNCPYGSIQMHDLGLVPNGARGWRFMPAAAVSSPKWHRRRFADDGWALADAPFRFDRQLRDQLTGLCEAAGQAAAGAKDRAIYFRLEFLLASYHVAKDSQFRLEVLSTDNDAAIWVNGVQLPQIKAKGGKREYTLPLKPSAPEEATPVQPLRRGRNVVAIKATPTPGSEGVLVDLRLDAVHRPPGVTDPAEEVTQKLVTEQAVVCDLCSSMAGQVPACVNACPHDAAMRIDARFDFPAK